VGDDDRAREPLTRALAAHGRDPIKLAANGRQG
jgi:hypothetical protein